MSAELPREIATIAAALRRLGGRSTLSRICALVRELHPVWPLRCKTPEAFTLAVRTALEDYSQGTPDHQACFERLGPEEYRVIPPGERAPAKP
jgi:hypothetical protein